MIEYRVPLENAIVERVNGIIKDDYLNDYCVNSLNKARELLAAVVKLYNNEIPHKSIGYLTPENIHENNIKTEKSWKNYYQKKLSL